MYYLIYLLFGKDKSQLKNELCYSLLSFDEVTKSESKKAISILIYTDAPLDLPGLPGHLHIQFQYLDEKDVRRRILSANGYPYIIKAFVLLEFLNTFHSYGLFVDTDTFFTKDAGSLFQSIEQGSSLMHLNEYPIVRYPSVHSYLEAATFKDIHGLSFIADPDFNMWNSGVIGIAPDHAAFLPDIIYLIQQMALSDTFKAEGKRLSEQLAFSYYFKKLTPDILAADEYLVHYWFFKEARYLLGNYFHQFFGSDETEFLHLLDGKAISLEEINKTAYADLPVLMFRLMRKFNLLDYYHYKALPPDSGIGKALRAE